MMFDPQILIKAKTLEERLWVDVKKKEKKRERVIEYDLDYT